MLSVPGFIHKDKKKKKPGHGLTGSVKVVRLINVQYVHLKMTVIINAGTLFNFLPTLLY